MNDKPAAPTNRPSDLRPQGTEDLALDHLLDEARTSAFHARQETSTAQNGSLNVRLSVDNVGEVSYTGRHRTETNYFGSSLQGKVTDESRDARGNLLNLERSNVSIPYLQMSTIPFIPATVHLSATRSLYDQNSRPTRRFDLDCHHPRYSSNIDLTCTGTVTNSTGEIIARQRTTLDKEGNVQSRVFRPDGHYLGEINSRQLVDPTGRVTTTDTTAHR